MPRVLRQKKINRGKELRCPRCPEGQQVIGPGDEYLKWSFRYGGTHVRCVLHPPRRSELTQSKMSEVYASIEGAEEDIRKAESIEEVTGAIESVSETTQEVAMEYSDAAEAFGGEGENAERAEELESWGSDLDSFYPDEDDDLEEIKSEAEELLNECPL